MEEILIVILKFVLELLLELFGYVPFDWETDDDSSHISQFGRWLCIGGLLGGLSLLLIKHALLAYPGLRIANLLLAPPASAFFAWYLAPLRRPQITAFHRTRSFWRAFAFSLGLVAVRFIYAKHG
ncbi:hypothetical protein [Chitinimonas sp.]|uniref:hypothetical protein n=1 Tax=Chitinimonas sp. TaxID=1934313 RepID=UPI0035B407E7